MVIDNPKEILFLCALQNAVKHGGVPQAGAVIGMVMGAMPVVGVPLPFISYGGSSLLSLLLGIGLIQSVLLHRQS